MIDTIETLVKQISHGVYVIGVGNGDRQNAFTAAWVMQKCLILSQTAKSQAIQYQEDYATNQCKHMITLIIIIDNPHFKDSI
jgi:hypothetical protein